MKYRDVGYIHTRTIRQIPEKLVRKLPQRVAAGLRHDYLAVGTKVEAGHRHDLLPKIRHAILTARPILPPTSPDVTPAFHALGQHGADSSMGAMGHHGQSLCTLVRHEAWSWRTRKSGTWRRRTGDCWQRRSSGKRRRRLYSSGRKRRGSERRLTRGRWRMRWSR